ncbi:MAG: adenylyltransferase/cytidyltransferase family protein [Halobacteriaceae archaeon]
MTVVVAQGTFDIIHPGHIHYLRESAEMGDQLIVIIARKENITHKDPPVLPNKQRRDVVANLEMVDQARIGHPEDIFIPIEDIQPDIIVLGHDQHHDADEIETALLDRGVEVTVTRASKREPAYEAELLSTNAIIDRIIEKRS